MNGISLKQYTETLKGKMAGSVKGGEIGNWGNRSAGRETFVFCAFCILSSVPWAYINHSERIFLNVNSLHKLQQKTEKRMKERDRKGGKKRNWEERMREEKEGKVSILLLSYCYKITLLKSAFLPILPPQSLDVVQVVILSQRVGYTGVRLSSMVPIFSVRTHPPPTLKLVSASPLSTEWSSLPASPSLTHFLLPCIWNANSTQPLVFPSIGTLFLIHHSIAHVVHST